MKVLFFEPYALALPHFETALELMQLHLDRGNDVSLFYCNADLNFCEANSQHYLPQCLDCISRRKNGLKLINGAEKIKKLNFLELTQEEKRLINNWNLTFSDIHELKAYKFEQMDLGMAVASSLISFYRDPEPDVKASQEMINRMFKASLKVYLSFKKILQHEKPDQVYLFNGRFSNIRPVVRLCEQHQINYVIHERGASKAKYSLWDDHLPHDFLNFQKLAEKQWNEADAKERVEVADKFYRDRKVGKEQSWFSFVKNQQAEKLPETWNANKRNIVIFNSSEDEFAAIGDSLKRTLFNKQLDGIRYIAELMKEEKDIDVYVRIHPNLSNVTNSSVSDIYKIKTPNLHIIEPGSSISSYKLMDSCDVVVTFGSTAGVEATYWDKPSILLGDSFYNTMNAAYIPQTHEALNELLRHETKPKEKIGAYIYGFYIATYGYEFRFYQPEALFEGKFKGTRIRPDKPFKRILSSRYLQPFIGYISKKHAAK